MLSLGKAIGLPLLVALGLMAFAAAAAQAEEFTIEGKTFAELKIEEEEFEEEATSTMTLAIAKLGGRVNCLLRTVDFPQNFFLWLTGGKTHRLVLYTMCTVLDNNNNELPCTVAEPIDISILSSRTSLGGKTYEVFTPSEGGTLGTLSMEGEECLLPAEAELKGTFAAETEAGERVKQPLTFSPEIEALLKTGMSYGAHKATLTGKTLMWLSGSNEGKEWGYK
jgi:hypothetical protein